MKLALAIPNAKDKAIEVSEVTFGRDYNEPLVHQVINAILAGMRQGTKAQKNRSAVSGGGAKPWRQKGTGRARAGTIRSPIWRTGGKTFAASPQNWKQKINKKMFSGAMRSILSELARQGRLKIVEEIKVEAPKTKLLVEKLKVLDAVNALIVDTQGDDNLYLSARNLPTASYIPVNKLNPLQLLKYDHVVLTVAAVRALEETYK
jgi:large subunit ribosomal protein L4